MYACTCFTTYHVVVHCSYQMLQRHFEMKYVIINIYKLPFVVRLLSYTLEVVSFSCTYVILFVKGPFASPTKYWNTKPASKGTLICYN